MRSTRILSVLIALSLLVAGATAFAQGIPTATLTGRAVSEGQGLPGVSVTAKSPALQGTRSAVTGSTGEYVFVNLPPGEYKVTFALSGFQPQTKSVNLAASQVSRVDGSLSLTAIAAEATVIGKTESISQTSTGATTYTSELTSKLPTARNVQTTVLLSPGVVNGVNGAQIAGSPSIENLYTVNGVVITDNVRSTPYALYIEDAIQETTTMTSGVSAEYGRFTGGVINTITKSGGNTFSGSLRSTIANQAWNSTSAYRTSAGVNPQEGTFIQKLLPTYEATLGGPFIKDVLWFFGAGRYQDRTTSQLTTYTNIPWDYNFNEKRYEGKLTISPFQNHTLTGSYINVDTAANNYSQGWQVFDLDTLVNQKNPSTLFAANYTGVLTDSFFVDAQYSRRKYKYVGAGSPYSDQIRGTPIYDLVLGPLMNSAFWCGHCPETQRNNNNWLAKATYFLSSPSLGSHNIVVGYDDFGGQRFEPNYQSGSGWNVYTGAASIIRGSTAYPVIDAGGEIDNWPIFSMGTSDTRTRSVYLNDSWRLNNLLSFNLGVRYDKNHAVEPLGSVTSNDASWSPRLAAIFDPKGDGKLRVTASYAKYVTSLQDTEATVASKANEPADFWWYFDQSLHPDVPNINTDETQPLVSAHDALAQVFAWLKRHGCDQNALDASCDMPFDAGRYPGYSRQLIGSLSSPYAQEYVLGFSGSIGSKGSYRADVVRREYKNFYDLRTDMSTGRSEDPVGNTYDLGLIETSSDYRREYTGLHTQFAYRAADRLTLGGNWTWSHLLGDAVTESSGAGSTELTAHYYPEYRQRSWNNPVGSLSTDQRHRVLLYGTYDVPMPKAVGNLTVGLIQRVDTGKPYGAVGTMDVRAYVKNPGYYSTVNAGYSVNYYYTARDAFRTETVYNTDLSLNYSYKIAGVVELFVQPQIYNIFNAQHITTPNSTVLNPKTASGYARFNPFTTTPVQGAAGTGANWNYGSNFGKATSPTGYQTPRYFNLTLGVRF